MTNTGAPGLMLLVLIYCCNAEFVTVPSPPVLTVTADERHVYMCNHSETIEVSWRVNGSRLYDEIFPTEISINIVPVGPLGNRVTTLEIGGRPEHNNTTIQCLAKLTNGSTVMTSNVSFFIQGTLGSVDSLERQNETILWEASFSIYLIIVYCVDVYNITCGRAHIISDCDVTNTSYTNEALQSGYIYEYTVTPRSNVEGAHNGTSTNVTEQFIKLQLPANAYSFNLVSNVSNGDSNNLQVMEVTILLNLETQEKMRMINLVYAGLYSLLLVSDHGNHSLLESTVATRNGSSVILQVSLPYRMLWNYTVLAYDCEEHPLSTNNELSTHDFQNISVSSPQPGKVRVTGDFIGGSTATGLLIIVISTSEIFHHFIEREKNQLHIEGTIQGLAGGKYSISFFVVEESGQLVNRAASTPKVVSIENSTDADQPSGFEYSFQFNVTGVCITCTFLNSSATDCVAVVHQKTSQLSSSGLMDIESSHRFTRSCETASGCIPGVNKEEYRIGVFTWMQPSIEFKRLTHCNKNSNEMDYFYILLLLLIILPVLLIIILYIYCRSKKKDSNGVNIDINIPAKIKSKEPLNGGSGVGRENIPMNSLTPQEGGTNIDQSTHRQIGHEGGVAQELGEDQRIEVEHGDQQHSQDRAIRIIKEIITQPIAQRINDTIGPCPVQRSNYERNNVDDIYGLNQQIQVEIIP